MRSRVVLNANPNRAPFRLLRISGVLAQFAIRAAAKNRVVKKFLRDWQTLFSLTILSVCQNADICFAQDDNSDALATTAQAA